MIKLIAFDWNGTLLSDAVACWEAANEQLKFCGCRPISLLRFKQSFKVPVIESLESNGVDRKFLLKHSVKVAKAFHEFYEKRAGKARTRSGAREVLAWLHKNKIIAMIYSNHTQVGIAAQLRRLKINNYIDVVSAHSQIDGSVHKSNKGQRLLSYIKKGRFKPAEVISVGDTTEEIAIGRNYGFHTVAITGGYNTTAMLKKQQPEFLIHNLRQLTAIIKKLNK